MILRIGHNLNEMPRFYSTTRARTYSRWRGKAVRGSPINSYSYANHYAKPRRVWSKKTVGRGKWSGKYKKKTYRRRGRR